MKTCVCVCLVMGLHHHPLAKRVNHVTAAGRLQTDWLLPPPPLLQYYCTITTPVLLYCFHYCTTVLVYYYHYCTTVLLPLQYYCTITAVLLYYDHHCTTAGTKTYCSYCTTVLLLMYSCTIPPQLLYLSSLYFICYQNNTAVLFLLYRCYCTTILSPLHYIQY